MPVWDREALPVIQIVPAERFYDFSAKYADDRTEYRFEFDVDAETVSRIADVGVAAAQALGMEGLSRADIRLTPDGRPFVLEVNFLARDDRPQPRSQGGRADGGFARGAVRAGVSEGAAAKP